MLKKYIGILLLVCILFGAVYMFIKSHKKNESEVFTRSVTAIRLKETNPVEKKKLTGVVKAWKEENLSFEVPGRIEWVIDKGNSVNSSHKTYSLSNGDGELIACLVPEKYELKLKSAKANVDTVKARIEASKVNINEVSNRQLESAKADMDNASKEFNRLKKLLNKNAISQKTFDTAETTLKKYQARYSEVRASIDVKRAEKKGLEASLDQALQAVADAELDIKRTNLRAPYQGKIADVYANIGAYVNVGQKVAKLVVMDPIVVDLNISPALDRKFHYGQFVNVYSPNFDEAVPAMVNRKATVADPNTHTFSLELLVRNRLVTQAKDIPDELFQLPRIKQALPVVDLELNSGFKTVVESNCIFSDNKGDYVWKLTETPKTVPGIIVYKTEKIRVTLQPGENSFLGAYKYRAIKKVGNLQDGDFVAIGNLDMVKDGDDVALIQSQYMFRPGNLVKVVLEVKDNVKKGFYIPLKMICSDSLKKWVFVVEREQDGSSIAKQVFIEVKNLFDDKALIESPELKNGDKLIYDGAHFIIPNEKINVKSIEKVVI